MNENLKMSTILPSIMTSRGFNNSSTRFNKILSNIIVLYIIGKLNRIQKGSKIYKLEEMTSTLR